MKSKKILIGVSSCLLGNKVRYDGGHQYQPLLPSIFSSHFELIPFCPEVEIGLGVPRAKITLIQQTNKLAIQSSNTTDSTAERQTIECVDAATFSINYTEPLKACVEQRWLSKISGYVLKTKSPSCGLTKVKIHINDKVLTKGQGIFAKQLSIKMPKLPLIEEDQLSSLQTRNAFIAKVMHYNQIKAL